VWFMAGSVLRESRASRFLNPAAIGAGLAAGAAAALLLGRGRKRRKRRLPR
jgi:hypothetical protein